MDYVVELQAVDRTQIERVGGKAATLGELSRIEGVEVPEGFCVTADAFTRVTAQAPSMSASLGRLSGVSPHDRETITTLGAEIRRTLETVLVPDEVVSSITRALARFGDRTVWAVRSSATAEDLAGASFAGQYDSFLDVVGAEDVLAHVRRCWASLFSDRALSYRLRAGDHHGPVAMAVVVQRMVVPRAAGVLFTADPVTSHRRVASVEAGVGRGDELVGGRVNPDRFTVRDGEIVTRAVASARSRPPALTDAQVVALVALGRRIEARLGRPQDIEWCLTEDRFSIVQSRPITTLFPVPEVTDGATHVYLSVGHQQMMTDAMRPLGISVWQHTAVAPMHEAGGRLFVDVTRRLASPTTRDGLLSLMQRGDPLIADALRTIVDRGDLLPPPVDDGPVGADRPSVVFGAPAEIDTDPAIVAELIQRDRASVAELQRELETTAGPALFDALRDAFEEHKRMLSDPLSMQAIMAGMQAAWWLNDHLSTWLAETNAADALTRAAPGNVTSEMGLSLLDVADAIRPHPQVVAFLREVDDDEAFLDALTTLPGGGAAQRAIRAFLRTYGMRCIGEIDITRPRWSERPATLVPLILDNIDNLTPGEAQRRRQRGRDEARGAEREILARLRELPDGERAARETERMIDRVRTFSGYREYPKYGAVSRLLVYKRALRREAERLFEAGVLRDGDDIAWLTFEELADVVATHRVDRRLIRHRREAFALHETLTAPRVLTSEGEVVRGTYRRDDVPAGALSGVGVCAGTVEGRARVVTDIARAELQPGDILVTRYTDPSWTPVFLSIAGLVTEAGGLMTHGAVIAREYGLPAVVGVEDATTRIADGQRIRLDGTRGFVEPLPRPSGDA